MADQLFVNNVKTTLAADIDATQTTLQATSVSGFPAPTGSQFFMIAIYDEVGGDLRELVKCTDVTSVTCTIVRGQEGTSGMACSAGDILIVSPATKGTLEALQTDIEALQTDIAALPDETISTAAPSGGANGDKWFKVNT